CTTGRGVSCVQAEGPAILAQFARPRTCFSRKTAVAHQHSRGKLLRQLYGVFRDSCLALQRISAHQMPHHLFRSIAGDSGYTSAVSKTRLSTTSNAALRAFVDPTWENWSRISRNFGSWVGFRAWVLEQIDSHISKCSNTLHIKCDYEFNSLSFLPTAPGPKLMCASLIERPTTSIRFKSRVPIPASSARRKELSPRMNGEEPRSAYGS